MEIKDTAEMMTSPDYKERFKAEYIQLKLRHIKLTTMLGRLSDGSLGFEPTCPASILYKQAEVMADYLTCLEARAAIEGVKLPAIDPCREWGPLLRGAMAPAT